MSQTKREQLVAEIEAFCAAKGLSDRQFSDVATQNAKFMVRLRRNAVNSRTMEQAELFLSRHADSSLDTLMRLVEQRRPRTLTTPPSPRA